MKLHAALMLWLTMALPAQADDPLFVDWASQLPGLTTTFQPSSDDLCAKGDIACVDAAIREMQRRFQPLLAACDHNAMFSLTYLRTTEAYRRAIEDPAFFSDTAFINHQDAIFARYYFDAWDAYRAGDLAHTPLAWQLAFDAADRRSVAGLGNLLLGLSAHVNRDLPYVLAAIGLVKPDGSSRKPDHDKVNVFLNSVIEPLLAEAAARLDPTVDDAGSDQTTLDETAALQLLFGWREQAWRNAELLVSATDPAQYAQVQQLIETNAMLEAQSLINAFAYAPLNRNGGAAARDAFCAEANKSQAESAVVGASGNANSSGVLLGGALSPAWILSSLMFFALRRRKYAC